MPEALLEVLLDSWDRNNAIMLNLLSLIPQGAMNVRPTKDSPTVAELFAHVHYVRLVFVLEDAPEFARPTPDNEWSAEQNRDRLEQMLNDSAKAVRDAVKSRVEQGKDMNL